MKLFKIFIFGLGIIFLFNFYLAAAQAKELKPDLKIKIGSTALSFEPVGPCKGGDSSSYCIGWISQYIGAVYRYGVGLAAVLASVMIMVGGFLWLSSAGNPSQITKGKDFIMSALTGLILALFSFLILQTINPRLVALEEIKVSTPSPPAESESMGFTGSAFGGGSSGRGGASGDFSGASGAESAGNEAEVRERLAQNGIDVWESMPGATVVSNLPEESLSYMEDVVGEFGEIESDVALTITGGTEEGYHSSRHGDGLNTFDVDRPNPEVDRYVSENAVDSQNLSWGRASYLDVEVDGEPMTAMWVDEGDHYHTELQERGYRE